jgi:alpha-methylacyl-CoA racemase
MAGPLSGYRIIELAGIGPAPFAGMMLADMGAEVIRVERAQAVRSPMPDAPNFDVLASADGLIEGFRPGVMERLGIGPDVCLQRNPKLVFGRMTGWGQTGPYANAAGHDINYISLAGALAHFGRAGEAPVPPLNMVGDFGGGGMLLAFGVVCALLEAQRSGAGQVIDAAMVDGTAILMSMFWGMKSVGFFDETRPGTNLLDTGAHFYDVYRCADDAYISIGSIEPQFYAELLRLTGLDSDPAFAKQMDRASWPSLKQRLADLFATKPRAEWCALLEATDVCFAPVLAMSDAAAHPHNVERGTFIELAGTMQPAPAPRFSRTVAQVTTPPAHPGQHTIEVLRDCGFDDGRIDQLIANRAVVAG